MRAVLALAVVIVCVGVLILMLLLTRPVRRGLDTSSAATNNTKPLVLVVGSGLAGLCAAIELAHANVRVVVAEQAEAIGGNSVRAKSGVSRPPVDTQEERAAMLADIVHHAGDASSKPRAELLVASAAAAHDWVRVVLGLPLPVVSQTGGHSRPRTYRTRSEDGPVGSALVNAAAAVVRQMGVLICLGVRLEDLDTSQDGYIQAVFAKGTTERVVQRAHAVILAIGGYANPRGPLVPTALRTLPTTNADTSIVGAETLAALRDRVRLPLIDVELIPLHPTALVDPAHRAATSKELVGEAVRGCGGRLLDRNHNRFVDELAGRKEVVDAMLRVGGPYFLEVPRGTDCEDLLHNYETRGLAVAQEGAVTLEVTPALHYAMGGLCVDVDCRVLAADKKPVARLYAAGECTGGLHGHNRLAGNSLLECIVYGRRAAATAVRDTDATGRARCSVVLCEQCHPTHTNRVVGPEELALHKRRDDVWVALHGTVYDVTRYVGSHPGGAALVPLGVDATHAFERVHAGEHGRELLRMAVESCSVDVVGTYAGKEVTKRQ